MHSHEALTRDLIANGSGALLWENNMSQVTHMTRQKAVGLWLLIICLAGCASKQRQATDDAVKALRKIKAAVQVGVNYQQYGSLVIDAQARVNEVTPLLGDNKIASQLKQTMDTYVDAYSAWGVRFMGLPKDNLCVSPDWSKPGNPPQIVWETHDPTTKLRYKISPETLERLKEMERISIKLIPKYGLTSAYKDPLADKQLKQYSSAEEQIKDLLRTDENETLFAQCISSEKAVRRIWENADYHLERLNTLVK